MGGLNCPRIVTKPNVMSAKHRRDWRPKEYVSETLHMSPQQHRITGERGKGGMGGGIIVNYRHRGGFLIQAMHMISLKFEGSGVASDAR